MEIVRFMIKINWSKCISLNSPLVVGFKNTVSKLSHTSTLPNVPRVTGQLQEVTVASKGKHKISVT